jgi:hypothetical protein
VQLDGVEGLGADVLVVLGERGGERVQVAREAVDLERLVDGVDELDVADALAAVDGELLGTVQAARGR